MSYDPDLQFVKVPSREEEYQAIAQTALPRFDGKGHKPSYLDVCYIHARYMKANDVRCHKCYAPFVFGDLSWRCSQTHYKHDCRTHQRDRRNLVQSLNVEKGEEYAVDL